MKYIISIGTNIGDRMENIIKALEAINNIPYTDVIEASSVYQTEPIGYLRQDDFYNAIFVVNTELDPHEMLGVCLGIESGFGRIRAIKDGPRILDLDIIFAENLKINTKNLVVPHPRYSERKFVLQPLLELFPDGNALGNDFSKYLDGVSSQGVEVVATIDKMLLGAC